MSATTMPPIGPAVEALEAREAEAGRAFDHAARIGDAARMDLALALLRAITRERIQLLARYGYAR